MNPQDLYIQLTDPTGKRQPVINHHRVWDKEKFLESQRKLHEQPKNPADILNVSVSTETQYRAFMGYKEQK